jgi:hypothetical protein
MGNLTFLRPPSPQVHAPAPGSHIGFTWGPMINAFDGPMDPETTRIENILPRPLFSTPLAQSKVLPPMPAPVERVSNHHQPVSAPASLPHGHRVPTVTFETPVRAASFLGTGIGVGVAPPSTIRRTVGGSARKAGTTRMLDEFEALKALGDCVRASARKKIVELSVGRPAVHASGGGGRRGTGHRLKLTLDFENISGESGGGGAGNGDASVGHGQGARRPGLRVFVKERSYSQAASRHPSARNGSLGSGSWLMGSSVTDGTGHAMAPQLMQDTGAESAATDTASEPPSPSPRPGSALSRRGSTPGASTPGGSGVPGSGSARSKAGNRSNSLTPILRIPSAGTSSFRIKASNTERTDPMGLFRYGERAPRLPITTTFEDDDATPRPLARHAAPDPDMTLPAPPRPAFQDVRADTSFNPFSEPNTTSRSRSRSQNENQFQHIRAEEVIDLPKSDAETESDGSPRDLQDEHAKEIAELEEKSNKQLDVMEARLAKMMEDIRLIEEGLRAVGDRVGRGLKA